MLGMALTSVLPTRAESFLHGMSKFCARPEPKSRLYVYDVEFSLVIQCRTNVHNSKGIKGQESLFDRWRTQ